MKLRDSLILTIASLGFGWVVVNATTPTQAQTIQDTVKVDTPIVVNVKNKTALFIGDSHTANHNNGWQKVLSTKVGFKMINVSILGKTTYWMLEQAHLKLNNKIDYCFVYGGANDMYTTSISVKEAVNNIKGIAKMCNGLGVKCIVITGFDPIKCTNTPNKNYSYKYSEFQRMLLNEPMEFAQVIDTRVVAKTDCWDGLCHMNPTGHRKIAEKVILDLNFVVLK